MMGKYYFLLKIKSEDDNDRPKLIVEKFLGLKKKRNWLPVSNSSTKIKLLLVT